MQSHSIINVDNLSTYTLSASGTMSTSSLSPRATNTYNLGASNKSYKNGYINNIYSNNISSKTVLSDDVSTNHLKATDAVVHNLDVTGQMHIAKLIIDEVKAAGGQLILSAADFTVDRVDDKISYISDNNFLNIEHVDNLYYHSQRVYQKATDENGKELLNKWQVGDMALCQTFNLQDDNSDVSNKYYWKYVCDCGVTTLFGEKYLYIDLLDSVDYSPDGYDTKVLNLGDGLLNAEVGDNIVLLGSLTDVDRQNAIIISAYKSPDVNVKAPSIVQYKGINDFTLSGHIYNKIASDGNLLRGELKIESGETIQDLLSDISGADDIHIYTAYANSADGTVDFSKENIAEMTYSYIGFCASVLPTDSTLTASDYSWSYIGAEFSDAPQYRLVPYNSRAYISATNILTLQFYYYAQQILGASVTDLHSTSHSVNVYYTSNITSTNKVALTYSTTNNYYYKYLSSGNFATTTSKPAYFTIYLEVDGAIVDRQVVQVQYLASAILEIKDNITAAVQDVSGNVSSLQIRADSIDSSISDVKGNLTTLSATVDGLSTSVQDAEGNISTLTSTVDGLSSTVSDAQGNISSLSNTVDGLTSTVSDVNGNISTLTTTVNGLSSTVQSNTDAISVLSQSSTDIQMTVNDLASGLVKAGVIIDGDNSKIDMIGSVELHDNGDDVSDTLKVYDADNQVRVTITPDTLPNISDVASLPQYRASNITTTISVGSDNNWTQTRTSTAFLHLGYFEKGTTIKIKPNRINLYIISKYTDVYDNYYVVVDDASINITRKDFVRVVAENANSIAETYHTPLTDDTEMTITTGSAGYYAMTANLTVTVHLDVRRNSSTSSSAVITPNAIITHLYWSQLSCYLTTPSESQMIISKDGFMFASGLKYAQISSDGIAFNNGAEMVLNDKALYLKYGNKGGGGTNKFDELYSNCASLYKVKTVTDSYYYIQNTDDFIVARSSCTMLLLPRVYMDGKQIKIKNLTGGNLTVYEYSSTPTAKYIYAHNSTSPVEKIVMSNGQFKAFICDGAWWYEECYNT